MKKINKKILFLALIIIAGITFIFNFYKVNNYLKMDKLDHSYFKKIKINSVITNVAIGRTLEIKILGINEWIRAGGCKLELSENQIELKESFLEGDSIFKIENSNKFIIIRNSEKFNWTIK